MFTVYILFSELLQKHYIGYTQKSEEERLLKHLSNHKGFTSKTKDWCIIYKTTLNSKTKALQFGAKD